jgi:dipeptidyl-peptidase-4
MKKLLLCSLLASLPLAADEFLKDYAETRGYLLGRPVKAKLTEQGRCYFLRSQSRTRSQSLYEWVNGQAVLRLTPEQVLKGQDEKLSPEEKARNERKRQLGTGFTEYFLRPHSQQLLLPISGQLILFDGQKWEKLPVAPGVLGRPTAKNWPMCAATTCTTGTLRPVRSAPSPGAAPAK